jgi:hypothetical protein
VWLALAAAAAHAQDFTGTYTTQNQTGGTVTFVLAQNAQGQITGSLSGAGVSFAAQGMLEAGTAIGTLSSDAGGVYFMAELEGSQLMVTLFEPDANNQPDYSRGQSLVFTRTAGGAPPPPSGNPLAQPTPPAAENPLARPQPTAPPALGGGSLAGWNLDYATPQGWQLSQHLGRIQMLASSTEAGAIFVAPGLYANFNEVTLDVTAFYQALGHVAYPVEQPSPTTIAGFQAMAATLSSQDQMGQTVYSRVVSLLTPHGTGLVIIGMTTPQQLPQLKATVERMAGTVRARPPEVNQQAIAGLRGRWMYYAGNAPGVTAPSGGASRSHEEYVTFDGAGNFQWQSSSSVSVTAPGMGGVAGGAGATSDQGTYTVIGNTLVMKGRQGQQAFQLQILADRIIADGRTYLRAN